MEKLVIVAMLALVVVFASRDAEWVRVEVTSENDRPVQPILLDRASARREWDIGRVRMREGEQAPLLVAFDCVRGERLERDGVNWNNARHFDGGLQTACDPPLLPWQRWLNLR